MIRYFEYVITIGEQSFESADEQRKAVDIRALAPKPMSTRIHYHAQGAFVDAPLRVFGVSLVDIEALARDCWGARQRVRLRDKLM
jgi:hypothetical protein